MSPSLRMILWNLGPSRPTKCPQDLIFIIKMSHFLVNEKVRPDLEGLPWEIVLDKTMQHHDTLQKLIIIGDTGRPQASSPPRSESMTY